MRHGIALLILACALVTGWSPAQRATTQDKERNAETARRAVRGFFDAVRANKPKTSARRGKQVVDHGDLAVDPLLDGVRKRSAREIVYALRAMGYLKNARTRSTVLALCAHESADIRAEAVVAGCRAHPSAMGPVLDFAVADPHHMVRRRAYDGVLSMELQQRQEFIGIAFRGIVDSDFWVRSRALRIISGALPAPTGEGEVDPVIAGAQAVMPQLGKDSAVPLFRILAKIRTKAMPDLVETGLRTGSIDAQVAAFGAAADLRLRDHGGVALRLLSSRSVVLANSAAAYLGRIRDRKSVPMLVDRLESTRDKGRREAIAVALRQITGRPFGYDVTRWRAWLDQQG